MNRHPSDPENWGSPALADLYSLLQKRAAMADSDTPGKQACAEFAQELRSGKAVRGMSRTARNPHSRDAVPRKQAMETSQRIPSSQIASIAASPAARQLLSFSQQQEKVLAAVALPDSVRGKAGANQNNRAEEREKVT